MTELSDYKRLVEAPQIRSFESTISKLRAEVESLSKALSEAEAQADKYCEWWREKRNECMAAESRLAEAMKVIGPFASRDMSDINDCVDNYDMRYQSQWFADATAAARRFLNAGKE